MKVLTNNGFMGGDGLRAACLPGGLTEFTTEVSGQPGQRCECDPLEPAWCDGALHFLLELTGEERKLEWLGDAAEHRAPLLGERNRGLEQLLHPERGPNLDPDERHLVSVVGEVVGQAGWDDDDLPGPGDDPLSPHSEAHRPVDDLEAFLLIRVEVQGAGDATSWGKLEVDRHQLAARLSGGGAERNPFAADRVHECLS
jgi:hypothetical protein